MAVKNSNKFQEVLDQIKNDCEKKSWSPVYLLQGEETFFISKLVDYLEDNCLTDAEKSFNQHIFYGRDITVSQLTAASKRYPMMSNHQLVIVKEAQYLSNLVDLIPYLENPLSSTILVLCMMGKSVNKTTKEGKALSKHFVFTSDPVPEWNLDKWIKGNAQEKGMEIGDKEALLLFEHIGNDLSRIDGELQKLSVNLAPRKKIEGSDIETYIGISREYNAFELQKAIGMKDFVKANKILKFFVEDPASNPFPLTLGLMFGYFQKIMCLHYLPNTNDMQKAQALRIPPFYLKDYTIAVKNYPISKLKRVFETMHDLDLKSKGIGARRPPDGELYKELIVKIMR